MTAWRNYQKYHAKKTMIDGIMFDSKKEADRYLELRNLQRAGEIKNLRMQVPYTLLPSQREKNVILKNGKTKPGKVLERSVIYKADFVYEENGETIVEDVKGMRTPEYIIKRKMMLYFHGIRIKEV